jgi:hypothetical protein
VNQQIGWVDVLGSQVAKSKPMAFTGLARKTAKGLPLAMVIQPDTDIRFLTENIVPMPLIQPFQGLHSAKFAVTDQKNDHTPIGKSCLP